MNEDIVKHSADSIKQRIIDKIRADFVQLVPDDQWDQLVQTELNAFLTAKYSNDKSPLNQMIHQGFKEMFQEKVKEQLSDAKWQQKYMPNGTEASDMVTKLIRENSEVFVANMMGNFVQNIVERIKSENFNNQF